MTSLSVRVARDKLADAITIERQRDTCYPCYIVRGPSGSVWLEQPSGRKNGWCVSHDDLVYWCGDFAGAKQHALEVVK
jgi:hypothetical protein